MSFGVAIPTYVKHLPLLEFLLDNIMTSTVKPDRISVSCSSFHEEKTDEFELNSVPVVVQYTMDELNPSQNRNRAASRLNTDLISFIDGDDLIHPKRIEYVKSVFSDHPEVEAIYHSYEPKKLSEKNDPFQEIENPSLLLNETTIDPIHLGIYVLGNHIQHAHVTLRKSVFDRFQFDENPSCKFLEDSLYARQLVLNGVNVAYLANPLSRYVR